MDDTLVADIECDGLLRELTRIWVLVIGDPKTGKLSTYADQPGYEPLSTGLERLSQARRVVLHNGLGYDIHAIEKLYPGTLRFEQVYDTLVLSRLLDPENRYHALADWGVKLGHPKVEHEEWDRFSPEMVHRCEEDVAITIKVYNTLRKRAAKETTQEAIDLEHKVALVIALQEQHGFRLNLRKAAALEAELRDELNQIEEDLQQQWAPWWVPDVKAGQWIFTPKTGTPKGKGPYVAGAKFCRVRYEAFNPGSRQQIERRLKRKYGWKPKKVTETGAAKLDDEILNDLAMQFPELKGIARYYRLKKQLGQLADGKNAWLKLYVPDGDGYGRVHGRVNPNGARTRRMSHFLPNMAQVDKKDLRMREVWEPDEGHTLVGVDAEGLELRMLAHFLSLWDGGKYGVSVVQGKKEDGTDVHTLTQKLAGLNKRDSAKTLIYAFLYGAGDGKLHLIITEDALEAGKPKPKGSPKNVGRAVRQKLEAGIEGLDKLVSACKKRCKDKGYVLALDGGRLYTPSEHSALNTLLQGAGAVVMKMALAIFHFELAVSVGFVNSNYLSTNGFGYCVNVHDEVQMSAEPEIAQQLGDLFANAIALAGERLGLKCPLAGSKDTGSNWKETH